MPEIRYSVTPGGQPVTRVQNAPAYEGGGDLGRFPPPDQLRPTPPPFKSAFGFEGSPQKFSDTNIDPHEIPYEKSKPGSYDPLYPEGDLPSNISDHQGVPGPYSGAATPVWATPKPQSDPHA